MFHKLSKAIEKVCKQNVISQNYVLVNQHCQRCCVLSITCTKPRTVLKTIKMIRLIPSKVVCVDIAWHEGGTFRRKQTFTYGEC